MKGKKPAALAVSLLMLFCGAGKALPASWRFPSYRPVVIATEDPSALEDALVQEVNRDRAAYGLQNVTADPALTALAAIRGREIVQKFSHTRPDGSSWSSVGSGVYAENIARGYDTAAKCEAAFLSSQGHRQNILHASYTKIGVCALRQNGVTYWVQLFGK